jgi:starch-binding outer membrane protein, SusD/RagB family
MAPITLDRIPMRRMRILLPAACLALAVAGCDTEDVLTVEPTTVVPASGAITDVVSARSATSGLYDALQSGSYYGEAFVTFSDLLSDNARHRGTFSTYANAEANALTSENTTIGGIWSALYRSIARANANIEALTDPSFVISEEEQNQMLGEAYFMRALSHHNAVKFWGDVPLITKSISTPAEAAAVTRTPVAQVYTQILADLASAEEHFELGTGSGDTRQASLLAAQALRARVHFYRARTAGADSVADYNAAIAAADEVISTPGVALAPSYADLFDPRGNATSEDILRVRFSDQDAGNVSYYYMDKTLGGRRELGPTDAGAGRITAAYETGDLRRTVSLALAGTRNYVKKFPSVTGTEHMHVIRLAEVILIKAESQARLGQLAAAIATMNPIRVRAGLAPLALGTMTRQQVVDAIINERRLELAFEGDRWADMIRTGQALTFLAAKGAPATQALYPIPSTELDTAPDLTQNPGY